MNEKLYTSLLVLGLLCAGCEDAGSPPPTKTAPKSAAREAQPTNEAVDDDSESQALMSEAPADERADTLDWGTAVKWRDWNSALETAADDDKAIAVVVYADWCPRCKELAPVFQRPDIAHAAANLVMVRQDQDADAPWLQERFDAYGRYVPRILFLNPQGQVLEDLQSGHPRYPYFYAPMVADRLLANLREASSR